MKKSALFAFALALMLALSGCAIVVEDSEPVVIGMVNFGRNG